MFCFIKSETSDSFVNHFDGNFAYLKTLDFYLNKPPMQAFVLQSTLPVGTRFPVPNFFLVFQVSAETTEDFFYLNHC